MKKHLVLIFIVSIIALSFSPGGGNYNRNFFGSINYFERTHNLRYLGMRDSVLTKDSKGKTQKEYIINNVAIHDINTSTTSYIFNDTIHHDIEGFYFETAYFEKYQSIEFNYSFDSTLNEKGLFQFENNKNISKRPISDKLIIKCYDYRTNLTTIWTCNKVGTDLKKAFEFNNKKATFEIDVYNKKLRLYSQKGKEMKIQEVEY